MRGFHNKPVPREVLEEIFESAKRAPSSMNTQSDPEHNDDFVRYVGFND